MRLRIAMGMEGGSEAMSLGFVLGESMGFLVSFCLETAD